MEASIARGTTPRAMPLVSLSLAFKATPCLLHAGSKRVCVRRPGFRSFNFSPALSLPARSWLRFVRRTRAAGLQNLRPAPRMRFSRAPLRARYQPHGGAVGFPARVSGLGSSHRCTSVLRRRAERARLYPLRARCAPRARGAQHREPRLQIPAEIERKKSRTCGFLHGRWCAPRARNAQSATCERAATPAAVDARYDAAHREAPPRHFGRRRRHMMPTPASIANAIPAGSGTTVSTTSFPVPPM